jgi:hypothetical protein
MANIKIRGLENIESWPPMAVFLAKNRVEISNRGHPKTAWKPW